MPCYGGDNPKPYQGGELVRGNLHRLINCTNVSVMKLGIAGMMSSIQCKTI